jgi:hypothetical protein
VLALGFGFGLALTGWLGFSHFPRQLDDCGRYWHEQPSDAGFRRFNHQNWFLYQKGFNGWDCIEAIPSKPSLDPFAGVLASNEG